MTDYSHYNLHSLPVYASFIDEGQDPDDKAFESILDLIEPPLFGDARDSALFGSYAGLRRAQNPADVPKVAGERN